MSNETRVLVHAFSVPRSIARCDRTHVLRDAVDLRLPLETLFDRHAAQMTRVLLAETRPGVMVFALGPHRIEGTMWLRATDEYRAGSIGRHGHADLFLNAWDTVSLRHCLVLVRKSPSGPRLGFRNALRHQPDLTPDRLPAAGRPRQTSFGGLDGLTASP